jgi:hypothetical protein
VPDTCSGAQEEWQASKLTELHSIVIEHDSWELVPKPDTGNAVTAKWVNTIKSDGRRKSRFVARGFTQEQGIDYNETFAPVAKMATIRLFLSLVGILMLFTHQLDVKTAFLNARMEEDVWVKPPADLESLYIAMLAEAHAKDKSKIKQQLQKLRTGCWLKLKKSLYGTKQAPRNWYNMLDAHLKVMGFGKNFADPCFYSKCVSQTEYVLLIVYVDDIIIGASTAQLRSITAKALSDKFKVSLNDELSTFLNMDITVDHTNGRVTVSQQRYIQDVWEKFKLPVTPKVMTPLQDGFKINIAEEEIGGAQSSDDYVARFPYLEMLGSLLFLAVCTRPTIAYAIGYLARFSKSYNREACRALERVLQYVYNTRETILVLGGKLARLVGYSDSDFAGDERTRKSTSGFILFLGNGPIVWYSKLQTIVAQSTAEAEYVSLLPICQNIIWVRNLLHETGIQSIIATMSTTLWCDNKAAIELSVNPKFHSRTKHIGKIYHLVRVLQECGVVTVAYVNTTGNIADIFTKAVGLKILELFTLMVHGNGKIEYNLSNVITTTNDDYK